MTLRSKRSKEHDTVRLRIIAERLHGPLVHQVRPRRIARVSVDWRTGRVRLLPGQASQSKTPRGRRWRLVLRIKRRVATWFRRREL